MDGDEGEVAVARLASGQRGRVKLEQLVALGLDPRRVRRWVASGRLLREFRGVYVVGHWPQDPLGRYVGALMACGRRSVVALGASAATDGWAPHPPGPVDVIVAGAARARRPGLRMHRMPLAPQDVVVRHGLRITAAPATLLHLAAVVSPFELGRLTQEAFATRATSREEVLGALARYPRARGARPLRELLEAGFEQGDSHPERVVGRALRRTDLPRFVLRHREGRFTPDLVWTELGLVVEIDGYASHSSPWAFARDRRKDRDQAHRNREVLRFTAVEATGRTGMVVAEIARGLGRREALRHLVAARPAAE